MLLSTRGIRSLRNSHRLLIRSRMVLLLRLRWLLLLLLLRRHARLSGTIGKLHALLIPA